jgi:ectoine hydroxylase-related dioxygenase (phytanoyl-CoA dioxygenase family)
MKSLPQEHLKDARLSQLKRQGYTIIEDAIEPELLEHIRVRFDQLVEEWETTPTAVHDEHGIVNLNRIYELDPVFECLMDLQTVFPFIEEVLEGDITLLGGAIGHHLPPRTPSPMAWHSDGPYLRLTYILSDLEENGGGTALVPGSHLSDGPPPWLNSEEGPHEVPGMIRVHAPAGSCMVNMTRLWHTRTPNASDQPRRIIWQVLKHSHQELTKNTELLLSPEYIDRQTDLRRRMLMGLEPTPKISEVLTPQT